MKHMTKRALSFLLTLVMLCSLLCTTGFAAGAAWDGSSVDTPTLEDGVYQIGTAAELAGFAKLVNSGSTNISGKLTADIDLNNQAWTPIGGSSAVYTGTFDGDGHTISNLYIMNTDTLTNMGLFGRVGTATIKNLVVTGSVTSAGSNVGGIAGTSGAATFENVGSEVTVSGKSYVGGIVGYALGAVKFQGCYNKEAVTGTETSSSPGSNGVGGIIGRVYNASVTLTDCYNLGNVKGGVVGGLVGSSAGTANVLTNCYNGISAAITCIGTGNYYGSIAGYLCLDTGFTFNNVYYSSGRDVATGSTTTANKATVYKQYEDMLNGLGSNFKSGEGINADGAPALSWETAASNNCTVIFEGSNAVVSVDGAPVTAVNVKAGGSVSFTVTPDKSYRVGSVTANGTELTAIAGIYTLPDVTSDITVLIVTNAVQIGGVTWDGSSVDTPTLENGVYRISTAAELAGFAALVNSGQTTANAILTTNIDLNDETWTPIGNSVGCSFCGTFDGGGHTVSGLATNGAADYQGLFGFVGGDNDWTYGTVKNLVVQGNVTGTRYVGGVAGTAAYADFQNVGNEATVTATGYYAGGIVGYCTNTATFTGCYNKGAIRAESGSSSSHGAGGIVGTGYNNSITIENCYNLGIIWLSGMGGAGGLIGYASSAAILNSYNGISAAVYASSSGGYGGCIGGYITTFVSGGTVYYYAAAAAKAFGVCGNPSGTQTSYEDYTALLTSLGDSFQSGAAINADGAPALDWEGAEPGGDEPVVSACVVTFQASNASAQVNGQSVTSYSVDAGGSVTFTVAVDADCNLVSVTANGVSLKSVDGTNYQMTDITRDIAVEITAVKRYVVSFTADNATVSGVGVNISNNRVTVDDGSSVSFIVTAAEGYWVDTITVEGTELTAVENVYTLPGISASVTVTIITRTGDEVSGPWDGTKVVTPGLKDGMYQIGTAAELAGFAKLVNTGSTAIRGELTADIDLNDQPWTPIGTASYPFCGTLDGGYHTVSGLYVAGATYAGLFGYAGGPDLDQMATVKNLIVQGSVSGTQYVGGVAGRTDCAAFVNVGNEAAVTSPWYAGGIVGYCTRTTTFTGCYNKGAISVTGGTVYMHAAGGIAGNAGAEVSVTNCYNLGTVTAVQAAGGLIGAGTGSVTNLDNSYNGINATVNRAGYSGCIIGYYMALSEGTVYYNTTACTSGGSSTPPNDLDKSTKLEYEDYDTLLNGADPTEGLEVVLVGLGSSFKSGEGINADGAPALVWETAAATYTITYDTNGGSELEPTKYTSEVAPVLGIPAYEGRVLDHWEVTSVSEQGNWTVSETIAPDANLSGRYGDVTLKAVWDDSVRYAIQDYLYAFEDGVLLIVAGPTPENGQCYLYNGEPMFYTEDHNYTSGILGSSGVYLYIISKDDTDIAGKITVGTGENVAIARNGDVTGNGKVEFDDVTTVNTMVIGVTRWGNDPTASNYLSIQARLEADMSTDTTGSDQRGTIADVAAIVAKLRGD